MNRHLWTQRISQVCPAWPCHLCKQGTLSLVPKSLISKETVESVRAHAHDDWDPEWIRSKFTAWAQCGYAACKQEFALAGDGGVSIEEDSTGHLHGVESYRPLMCTPMPDMIVLPDKCPEDVAGELRNAFVLFWADRNACVNRLRVALEYLMTHLGIPKVHPVSGGDLKLHNRIELYAKSEPATGAQLMALKWVGNAGSHEGLVNEVDTLDAFEVLEYALVEILEKRSAKMAALAQELIKKHS